VRLACAEHRARGAILETMHRCPQCDYALGPIAGVPADRFGAFTAAVHCPECGFEIPEGARILVGSVTAAGVQPLTRGRRLRQVALAVLPMFWFLQFGVRGLSEVITQGPRNLSAWSVLKAASLVAPCLALWTAWLYWSPKRGDDDAGALASRDMRWLCTPGALFVYHGSSAETADSPGVDLGMAVGARGQVQVVRNKSRRKRIDADDVASIRVYATEDTGKRRRAGDRIAARLVANTWERGRDGRRKDMHSWEINIDTAAEPGPPGTDHAAAAIEAGDRIANLVRQSLGLARRAEAPTAVDAFGADAAGPPIVIEGSRYALPPLHAQRQSILMAMVLPFVFTAVWPVLLAVNFVHQVVTANGAGPAPGFHALPLGRGRRRHPRHRDRARPPRRSPARDGLGRARVAGRRRGRGHLEAPHPPRGLRQRPQGTGLCHARRDSRGRCRGACSAGACAASGRPARLTCLTSRARRSARRSPRPPPPRRAAAREGSARPRAPVPWQCRARRAPRSQRGWSCRARTAGRT